jgi:enoyl-CoA hydratase
LPENQLLTTEITNECAVIRFTNLKERNPLSIAVLETLDLLLNDFIQRQDVERIIFTGMENVFASGANLREISKVTKETAREFALRGQLLMKKIDESPKRMLAAVNGLCFGGAFDLALSCDVRIASPNAVFCHPGANLGIITGWGGTQRLPRLVGEAQALEIFLMAKQIKAEEALRIGLIDAIAENVYVAAIEMC